MKNRLTLMLLSSALIFASASAHANDASPENKEKPAPASSVQGKDAWMKQAVAEYPLKTCVVSGEALDGGEMGEPVNYTHKESEKPDRLVRFCCGGRIKDFKKNPAKFLKKIDEAAAKAPAAPVKKA